MNVAVPSNQTFFHFQHDALHNITDHFNNNDSLFVIRTISRVSLVKLKVSGRMSMLVALSSLSLRSVEMLNCM